MTHATLAAIAVLEGAVLHPIHLEEMGGGRRACPTNRNLPVVSRKGEVLEFDRAAAYRFLAEQSCQALPACLRCQAEILSALGRRARRLATLTGATS